MMYYSLDLRDFIILWQADGIQAVLEALQSLYLFDTVEEEAEFFAVALLMPTFLIRFTIAHELGHFFMSKSCEFDSVC